MTDFDHTTGRPENQTADELARGHTAEAIQCLVDILKVADFDSTRVAAARELLDRGHGKPVQAVIQIPQRRAKRYQLASMTEAELIERIERASLPSMFEAPCVTAPPVLTCETSEESQAIACDPLLE